jgi:hypothetical protein
MTFTLEYSLFYSDDGKSMFLRNGDTPPTRLDGIITQKTEIWKAFYISVDLVTFCNVSSSGK